jgi:hypothetical protein
MYTWMDSYFIFLKIVKCQFHKGDESDDTLHTCSAPDYLLIGLIQSFFIRLWITVYILKEEHKLELNQRLKRQYELFEK